MVAVVEVLIRNRPRPADAFGDVLPGHFKMHATGMGALRGVNREERLHLGEDAVEGPGLVAGGRGDGVAVHRIARPDHRAPLALHRADEAGQMLTNLVGAETVDQRQPARLVVRVEYFDQLYELIRLERRPAFQADRILDAAEIFHVAVIELAGAVADPDHVAGGRIPVASRG